MAAPTYTPGTVGNVLNAVPIAAGKNAAALVDLSTVLGGALDCSMATGAPPPTAATTFAAYRVHAAGAAGNTNLSAGVTAGATAIGVNSAAGIGKGQKIAIVTAAGLVGEAVTVASVSGTALTLSAGTTGAYSAGDLVFLIEQTASGGTVAPGSSWAANTTYGTSIYPPSAWVWIVQASNGDATNSVTVTVTLDKNPAFS
jgi:hypothetical protein